MGNDTFMLTVSGAARRGRLPVTEYNQEGSNPFETAYASVAQR
jgi:hypothetical protein